MAVAVAVSARGVRCLPQCKQAPFVTHKRIHHRRLHRGFGGADLKMYFS